MRRLSVWMACGAIVLGLMSVTSGSAVAVSTKLTVKPTRSSVVVGSSVALIARYRNSVGKVIKVRSSVKFKLKPAGIASLKGRRVTGVTPGVVTITATYKGRRASTKVTVLPLPGATPTPSPTPTSSTQPTPSPTPSSSPSGTPSSSPTGSSSGTPTPTPTPTPSSTGLPTDLPTDLVASMTVEAVPGTVTDADTDGLTDMGDSLPVTVTVTNTGLAPLLQLAVTSSSGEAVDCPTQNLQAGESVACTTTHVVTLAEVGTGSLTRSFEGSATGGIVTATSEDVVTTFDRMNIALQHGLPNLVSYSELVTKANALKSGHVSLAPTMMPTTPMNWYFTNQGQSVASYAMPYQQVVLRSNHNFDGGTSIADLAVAGSAPGKTTRMAYAASNPFTDLLASPRTAMPDAGMNEFDVNLLKWLLNASDLSSTSFNVQLVNTWGSTTSGTEAPTRAWFAAHAPGLHLNVSECDLPANPCLAGADLVVFGGIGSTGDSPAIADQVMAAYDAGVPVLFMADNNFGDAPAAIAEKFGMTVDYSPIYWDHNGLQNSTADDQLPGGRDPFQQVVNPLLETTFNTPLALSDYSACLGKDTLYNCNVGTAAFTSYQNTLSSWRTWIAGANNAATSWFTRPRNDDQDLMRALVMLADKLRTGVTPSTQPGDSVPAVTYPVPTYSDAAAATRALFVDHTTMTAWGGNQAAGDTGTVYCNRAKTLAHTCTAPTWPGFGDHSLTLKATQNDEWQSTGFDAKPGVPVTVSLTSNPGMQVWVRTFFQRNGTTKSGQVDGSSRSHYDRPQFLATDWVPVTTTGTTFSSPYGGPLYIRIAGTSANQGTDVPLTFANVATHPTVLDMTDNAQVTAFTQDIGNGAYWVDLAGNGFQAHMNVDTIQASLATSGTGGRTWSYNTHGGLQQFLNDFRDQFVFTVYRMAGLQIGTQPLASTLDPDVLAACRNFGLPCEDANLNKRTVIQHINYDLHAQCGNLCSGNPIDADGSSSPAGWGENHELGHNLQRQQLNVMWPDTGTNGSNAAAANLWTNYKNRSGEVSNNLFPYHTAWNFYRNVHQGWGMTPETSPDTGTLSRDVGGVDAFSIAQSIRLGQNNGGVLRAYDSNCSAHNTLDTTATPTNIAIANAIWRNSGTYDDNNLRMSFYQQIALMTRGMTLSDNTVLDDGFGIWTLLYQAARGWSDATSTSSKWNAAAQTTYGMSNFAWNNDAVYGAGKTVNTMIGNDFLLIQLNKMTGYDWRDFFQLHGVLYTAQANQQVDDNTPAGGYKSFNSIYPALGAQLPFADMSNIGTVDTSNAANLWPGAFENSITTKSKVNFTPTSCP